MSKKVKPNLDELIKEFKVIKKDIAKKRDRLRDIKWEIESICESVEEFEESARDMLEAYENSLTDLSKYL